MNELKNRFHSFFPDKFFLEYSVKDVNNYLSEKSWLLDSEYVLELEKAGEGNMNLVMRIKTNLRSFILKQSRPWVEKYPHIDAPVERNHVEAAFFYTLSKEPVLHSFSPEILGHDPLNYLLYFNDLGDNADFTFLYEPGNHLMTGQAAELLNYISVLHHLDCPDFPLNRSMRELNHEYIFRIPFLENNGLDLNRIQPGLADASLPYKNNKRLLKFLESLGNLYLREGPVLIHGDYFPGSWLRTSAGIKIIDPEFGFKGYAEFDLGVMMAHMVISGQKDTLVKSILKGYDQRDDFDMKLFYGFAGTEILRRILGVAQLPLTLSLTEKINIMRIAEEWILNQ